MKVIVRTTIRRRLVLAGILVVLCLPIIVIFFHLVEIALALFVFIFLIMARSEVVIECLGDRIEISKRIGFWGRSAENESIDDIQYEEELLNGAGDSSYYDIVVTPLVLGRGGRSLFSRIDRAVFGANRLAKAMKEIA